MCWLTLSVAKSVFSWHRRYRKDFVSRQRVDRVVVKYVPPTFKRTHLLCPRRKDSRGDGVDRWFVDTEVMVALAPTLAGHEEDSSLSLLLLLEGATWDASLQLVASTSLEYMLEVRSADTGNCDAILASGVFLLLDTDWWDHWSWKIISEEVSWMQVELSNLKLQRLMVIDNWRWYLCWYLTDRSMCKREVE